MKIGYARVSTDDQKLDLQIQALTRSGCRKLFFDRGISGTKDARPGLDKMLRKLKQGDTLVVWRLDRLGRSLVNLIHLVGELERRGINFRSLTENIDTTSSSGRLVFHMMAALSEFERSLISERTKAGMDAAKRQGRRLGRPHSLSGQRLASAIEAVSARGEHPAHVAKRFKVSVRTLSRAISRAAADPPDTTRGRRAGPRHRAGDFPQDGGR